MQNSLARLREREGTHRAAVGRVRVPSRARVKNRRAWYKASHFSLPLVGTRGWAQVMLLAESLI